MHPNWVCIKAGLWENFKQVTSTLYCNKYSVEFWSSAELDPSSSASYCRVLKTIIIPSLSLDSKHTAGLPVGILPYVLWHHHSGTLIHTLAKKHLSEKRSADGLLSTLWQSHTTAHSCTTADHWPGFIKPMTAILCFTMSQQSCTCKWVATSAFSTSL